MRQFWQIWGLEEGTSQQELNRYQRRRNWQWGQEVLGDVISQSKNT